jgi:hypothetical protein
MDILSMLVGRQVNVILLCLSVCMDILSVLVGKQGAAFAEYLMSRPETRIAVVTHSSFLFFMMKNFGHPNFATTVQGELHRWYENCEMRSVVLCDAGGRGGVDPTWFPGGRRTGQ